MDASWVEAFEVDAVAEQPRVAREVPALHEREVLFVLVQLRVRAPCRRSFDPVHGGAPRPRVVSGRVQPVHGVHHDRHAREAADHASVDAGLGVVGVQDVDRFAREHAAQLTRGAEVGTRIVAACRGRERDVADSFTLERGDMWTRCADADRDAARVAHGAQLREQQEAQAHVDRGEVGDPSRPAVDLHVRNTLR